MYSSLHEVYFIEYRFALVSYKKNLLLFFYVFEKSLQDFTDVPSFLKISVQIFLAVERTVHKMNEKTNIHSEIRSG